MEKDILDELNIQRERACHYDSVDPEVIDSAYLVIEACRKRIDDLTFDLSAAHRDINELERELSQAIDIIEDSGVDYDEIVKAREIGG
jgi:hypothetical protein